MSMRRFPCATTLFLARLAPSKHFIAHPCVSVGTRRVATARNGDAVCLQTTYIPPAVRFSPCMSAGRRLVGELLRSDPADRARFGPAALSYQALQQPQVWFLAFRRCNFATQGCREEVDSRSFMRNPSCSECCFCSYRHVSVAGL